MPKHILTVDDEPSIRELIAEALMAAGFRVTAVATAEEVLHVVKTDPPHLVITDLQLEECDGFAVADQVKAIAPHLPIVLLTGILFEPDVVQGPTWQKISAYIPKTNSLEQIVQAVKRLIPG
jgi:DNA-binding NtrC family response regulator